MKVPPKFSELFLIVYFTGITQEATDDDSFGTIAESAC